MIQNLEGNIFQIYTFYSELHHCLLAQEPERALQKIIKKAQSQSLESSPKFENIFSQT